ncbi:integral membrane protein GPR155-like protein [Dinothrombium tinctorium]|uniref:Integral membrane protein GPR155-like protein n=1 Tax=Dinothrombium tinctorium TaxID=1965070 RepID=A0A443QR24_9ACAR|nr:integral membrane protein GPR155-like protein [Dinothrombium tinctorium]
MEFIWSITECFFIIFIGYITGKWGMISDNEANGLNLFVTHYSLPALVFRSIATIRLSEVNWSLVASIFLAKVIIFLIVVVVTLVLTKPVNCGKAGLYGILCTQSNDFAIGYLLLQSLYTGSKAIYVSYIYVLAPVQLLLINPFGLILMELQKFWNLIGDREHPKGYRVMISVLTGILKNPIVTMTILGILWNRIFGQTIPDVFDTFLDTLGKAFAAVALFLLGLNLVGKLNIMRQSDIIFLPLLLTVIKLIALPLITRVVVYSLFVAKGSDNVIEASSFGFLYGTFPTAPSPFIFAVQYGMDTDVAATEIAMSTLTSGPLMYVSSAMVKMVNVSMNYYHTELGKTTSLVSIISSICLLWVLFLFIFDKKWKSCTHRCTLFLIASQMITSIGGIFWIYLDTKNPNESLYKIQYILCVGGAFMSHIGVSALSLTLALIYYKGIHFISKIHHFILIGASIITALFLSLFIAFSHIPDVNSINPAFEFSPIENFLSIFLLVISLIFSSACLIYQQYLYNKRTSTDHIFENYNEITNSVNREQTEDKKVNEGSNREESLAQEIIVEEESSDNELTESALSPRSEPPNDTSTFYEIKSHVLLVLLLNFSMFVTLMVTIKNTMTSSLTGILVELEYLSILLNFGQGIILFVLFGFDLRFVGQIFSRCSRKKEQYMFQALQTDDFRPETKGICEQFVTFHSEKFSRQMKLNDRSAIFKGSDLIDWLLREGVVNNTQQATKYCCHLLWGQVIERNNGEENLFNGSNLYRVSSRHQHAFDIDK